MALALLPMGAYSAALGIDRRKGQQSYP